MKDEYEQILANTCSPAEAKRRMDAATKRLAKMFPVSPWRSLESDPPEPPTEDTTHAVLVRAARHIADDRYRLLVPYQDSDNGNCWRWFESHLDYVLEDLAERGYTEWMAVPE